MMGMLMEVARMTMMITMRVMVVLTRMMGMLLEVTRMTTMMTMNEMKGDDDYGNGDIYIMMQCLFVTFLFIPAPPPAPLPRPELLCLDKT